MSGRWSHHGLRKTKNVSESYKEQTFAGSDSNLRTHSELMTRITLGKERPRRQHEYCCGCDGDGEVAKMVVLEIARGSCRGTPFTLRLSHQSV